MNIRFLSDYKPYFTIVLTLIIEIFLSLCCFSINIMKSSELNRLILKNGWMVLRQNGSHVTYQKNGICYTATFHGSKEVGKGLEMKIKKEMGLK